MLVIPAIDLKGGRCVRLWQGRADQETVYADDPVAIAERWRAAGATLLHIVDLDGAFQGRPMHLEVVQAIAEQVSVPIQYGGGVRNEGDLRAAMALVPVASCWERWLLKTPLFCTGPCRSARKES